MSLNVDFMIFSIHFIDHIFISLICFELVCAHIAFVYIKAQDNIVFSYGNVCNN